MSEVQKYLFLLVDIYLYNLLIFLIFFFLLIYFLKMFRFFKFYHDGHYKIYNLCCERKYDPGKFDGSVALFTFQDHNAPPFRKILDYCEDVKKFLDENKSNVAATHCKAGIAYLLISCYFSFHITFDF